MATDRAEAAARRFDGNADSDAAKMLEAGTLDAVYRPYLLMIMPS